MDFRLPLFVRMLVIDCWYVVETIIMILHVVVKIFLMLFVLYLVNKMTFKVLNVRRWMTVVSQLMMFDISAEGLWIWMHWLRVIMMNKVVMNSFMVLIIMMLIPCRV